jgi:hypothetical protein
VKRLATTRLADPALERVRQEHADAITELQRAPLAEAHVVENVRLADGVPTPVAHWLGRLPIYVRESCPRGASSTGRVDEIRTGSHDRSKYVVLQASGWGATIVVDVMVA